MCIYRILHSDSSPCLIVKLLGFLDSIHEVRKALTLPFIVLGLGVSFP